METVEAGPAAVRRVTPSGCERRPRRSNGGQRSWSLAAGGLARAQHRIAQCLLRLARDSAIDRKTDRLTRRTAGCGPACPVVWEGRSREASPYPNQNASRVSSEWIEASSQYAWRRSATVQRVQLCSAGRSGADGSSAAADPEGGGRSAAGDVARVRQAVRGGRPSLDRTGTVV